MRPVGALSDGGEAVRALSRELETYKRPVRKTSDVAIVFDYDSQWAWEIQPQDKNFDYFRLILDVYKGLRKQGYTRIDILPPDTTDFGNREAVFIPGLYAWTDKIRGAVDSFDGKIIIGPRTGSRTEDFQIPTDLPPALEGLKVIAIDTLREDSPIRLDQAGNIQIWREVVETNWNPLVSTLEGDPVVFISENMYYWAAWPDPEALEGWLSL